MGFSRTSLRYSVRLTLTLCNSTTHANRHSTLQVLLTNAVPSTTDKLPSLGISDGTEAEEEFLKLLHRERHPDGKWLNYNYKSFVRICFGSTTGHVYGICVSPNEFYTVTKGAESKLLGHLRDKNRVRMLVAGITASFMIAARWFYGGFR